MALTEYSDLGIPEVFVSSKIETDRFGRPVGRLSLSNTAVDDAAFEDDESVCTTIVDRFKDSNLDVLILRYPARKAIWAGFLGLSGLGVIHADTLVYYRSEDFGHDEVLPTRQIEPEERSAFEAVVRESFIDYHNHYRVNPLFDPADCLEGYVEWALRSLTEPAQSAWWILDPNGSPLSFVTARIDSVPSGDRIGETVIGGVLPIARRQGAYQRMIMSTGAWFAEQGCSAAVLSTQVWNHAVQKTWVKLGYQLTESFVTLHLVKPSLQR